MTMIHELRFAVLAILVLMTGVGGVLHILRLLLDGHSSDPAMALDTSLDRYMGRSFSDERARSP